MEGALVTDAVRSYGVIAANTSRGSRRARFTVAHELGHFLMERHRPTTEDGFACRGSDMRETRAGTRHQRQEMEANRFAISALAPPRMVAPFLREDPDLGRVGELAKTLDISREAAARRYVDLHDELLAVVWSVGGVVRYSVRNERFPWLEISGGNRLSGITPAARAVAQGRRGVTRMTETSPAAWIGSREVELFEQTRVGRDGHAATLLWAEMPEGDDQGDADSGVAELGEPTFGPRRRR
ncbi:MAG: ImmA/IrrE family metallo-endopeptidase [Pseudomonadota bacterium]